MSNKRNQNEICLEKDKKTNNTSYPCLDAFSLLPPANEVWGKVIFSEACVKNSIHRGGGGIPACLAAGLQGRWVVFQHALQVSRPTPRGEVEGDLARGVSRPTPKGEVERDLARGVSRPTPKGEVEGDLARRVSRPTPWGAPGPYPGGLQVHTWGVYPSIH